MDSISAGQIRQFRLHTHHLDTWYPQCDTAAVAGACGFQNTPPGAWETALHNRVPEHSLDDMRRMLEREKSLLQAWSFRGAPVIFPASDSDAFLASLVSEKDEKWIYTAGIQLALDFLHMPFEELLELQKQVMPGLDDKVITSKTALDQTVAEWMLPLLPPGKRDLWNKPSMYGDPDRQTVGGAVVSFLLRPCAFMGLVVFGERAGSSPTFTSYKNWVGHPLKIKGDPGQKLVRKFLRCYGPARPEMFAEWLGCSPAQARRMWDSVAGEMEPVQVEGKTCYMLSADMDSLLWAESDEAKLILLGAHDPYLDMKDKTVILENKSFHTAVWKFVANPGAVLKGGRIIGTWKTKTLKDKLDVSLNVWENIEFLEQKELERLAEKYAAFRLLCLKNCTIEVY